MTGPGDRTEAARWLAQAGHDLRDAQFAAEHDLHALACFLSQQAAEKAVSAFLFSRGADRVWGHALADLCEDAIALDPSFDLIKSVAMLLDKYYSTTRYPTSLPGGVPHEAFGAVDARGAIETATEVLGFVESRAADEG